MKLLRWTLAAVLAAALAACAPPPAGVHETLRISERGEYSLNGVTVPREQLGTVLAKEQARVHTLFAEVVASPRANIEAVTYAVQELKSAGVRFAFVDEQIMNSAKPQGAPAEF